MPQGRIEAAAKNFRYVKKMLCLRCKDTRRETMKKKKSNVHKTVNFFYEVSGRQRGGSCMERAS